MFRRTITIGVAALLSVLLTSGAALASFAWDEDVHGDLSDDGLTPTVLAPGVGDNTISASVGWEDENDDFDDDFFAFTVPSGWTFDAAIVTSHSSATNTTFLGIEDDTVYVTGQGNPDYYGYTFFGQSNIGTDILPAMGLSNGNFAPPLGPGDYAFWVDESTGPETYSLTFRFVPEPGSLTLLALAGLLATKRLRAIPRLDSEPRP